MLSVNVLKLQRGLRINASTAGDIFDETIDFLATNNTLQDDAFLLRLSTSTTAQR
jgi:hypothetical protein